MSLQEFIRWFFPMLSLFLILAAIAGAACAAVRSYGRGDLRLEGKHMGPSRWSSLAKPLLPAMAVMVFMIPLLHVWLNAFSDNYCAYGLLPWSDAGAYYMGAEDLLETGRMADWNCRRPLATVILAVHLAVTGHNLPAVQVIQAILLALSVYALAHAVGKDLGWPCGLMIFAILFAYVESVQFTHWFSSEWLGMAVGALAATLLWNGSREGRKALVWWGTAVLTMALNARSGAFLVLPALVLWAGMAFRENRLFRWNMAALCAGGILFGFLVNGSIMKIYGNRFSAGHGNYSLVLYGLASGNSGWRQIYRDFPETKTMPENALIDFAYEKSLEQIKRNPQRLMRSLAIAGKDFIAEFLTPFETARIAGRKRAIQLTFGLLLSVCALIFLWRNRQQKEYSMLMASFAGIVISAPFLWVDGGARIYAATFPILAVFLSTGICRRKYTADPVLQGKSPVNFSRRVSIPAVASLVFVAVAVAGPAAAHRMQDKIPAFPPTDSADRRSVVIRQDAPRITVLRSHSQEGNFIRKIGESEYFRNSPSFAKEEIGHLPRPGFVYFARDWLIPVSAEMTEKYVWVLAPEKMGGEKRRYLSLRGEYRKETNIFHVSEFSVIENVRE